MDVEVRVLQKPYETLLNEYMKIMEAVGQNRIKDDFISMWSSYSSSVIEETGWKAIWKPSKLSCLLYNLDFSSSIMIEVKDIDFSSLSADITVIEDEQNRKIVTLSETSISIPLKDLYITSDEESSNLSAVECLDKLRLLYNYLLWPWETNEGITSADWFLQNLETRLQLYHDMSNGIYCSNTIKALIQKGKCMYEQILKLSDICIDNDGNTKIKFELTHCFKVLEIIKAKLKRFTNSNQIELLGDSYLRSKSDNGAYIVRSSYDINQLTKSLNFIAEKHPKVIVKKIVENLENISMKYNDYNMIFLSDGEHQFSSECLFVDVIIDCLFPERAIVNGSSTFWYMLKTTADNVTLSNFDIMVDDKNIVAIFVKYGITYLNSVTIRNITSTSRPSCSIIVGENGTLIANNCQFHNFNEAIKCLPGSAVQLTDCAFHGNYIDIQVIDDIQLHLSKVVSSSNKRTFIQYKGENPKQKFSSLETLTCLDGLSFDSLIVDNVEKAVEFV